MAWFAQFLKWCPPCMNLLPEFRKSSQLDASRSVLFGTVDCTTNSPLCEQYGIRSYPTTILFNNSFPHNYRGHHTANDIADFIRDILKPSVVILTYDTFHSMVGQKPIGKIWLVDFYASWCGPCQQLAPEWRKLAKRVDANLVSVGQVDCVVEQKLCMEQGIQSYPNIRIFPSDSAGFSRYDLYQGWMRDAHNLFVWVQNYMPSVSIHLDLNKFEKMILQNADKSQEKPWMVDFYAPWCGHCQVFAPTFESLASKYEGQVRFGKVNCQEHQYLCQLAGIRAYPTIKFFPTFTSSNNGVISTILFYFFKCVLIIKIFLFIFILLQFQNWNSGEDIQQYDFNSLSNTLDARIKRFEPKNKASNESNKHNEL